MRKHKDSIAHLMQGLLGRMLAKTPSVTTAQLRMFMDSPDMVIPREMMGCFSLQDYGAPHSDSWNDSRVLALAVTPHTNRPVVVTDRHDVGLVVLIGHPMEKGSHIINLSRIFTEAYSKSLESVERVEIIGFDTRSETPVIQVYLYEDTESDPETHRILFYGDRIIAASPYICGASVMPDGVWYVTRNGRHHGVWAWQPTGYSESLDFPGLRHGMISHFFQMQNGCRYALIEDALYLLCVGGRSTPVEKYYVHGAEMRGGNLWCPWSEEAKKDRSLMQINNEGRVICPGRSPVIVGSRNRVYLRGLLPIPAGYAYISLSSSKPAVQEHWIVTNDRTSRDAPPFDHVSDVFMSATYGRCYYGSRGAQICIMQLPELSDDPAE